MNEEKDLEIDLFEILGILKRKFLIILLFTLIGAGIGFGVSNYLITPMYESKVNMIVNTKSDESIKVTTDNINSANKMIDTYAIIIKSNTVLNKVIDNLSLDIDYKELQKSITVEPVDSTQVMQISVINSSRTTSARIINQIARIAPSTIIDSVEAGSCKVISEVETSDKPVSPSIPKYTLASSALFFVLTIGIIIIKELTSNYIVDENDVYKKLGLSVLGIIPEVKGRK